MDLGILQLEIKSEIEFISTQCLQYWQEDEWFAAMRLMGQNPVTIKLCTKIPDK